MDAFVSALMALYQYFKLVQLCLKASRPILGSTVLSYNTNSAKEAVSVA